MDRQKFAFDKTNFILLLVYVASKWRPQYVSLALYL